MPSNFVIIGLGNIGENYRKTRHNVGFDVLDSLCLEYKLEWNRNVFDNFFYQELGNMTLIKPTTYMNNSGMVLNKVKKRFLKEESLIVLVSDNMDLEASRIRLKYSGNTSSHKGIASILQYVDRGFLSLFVGISRPLNCSVIEHVLGRPYKESEIKAIDSGIKKAVQLLKRLEHESVDSLMNEFNKK